MRRAALTALLCFALSGCALAPGEAGLPIVPVVMILVGIGAIVWGIILSPLGPSGLADDDDAPPGDETR